MAVAGAGAGSGGSGSGSSSRRRGGGGSGGSGSRSSCCGRHGRIIQVIIVLHNASGSDNMSFCCYWSR